MEPMESRGQAMIRIALAQLKNDPGRLSTGKPGTYLRREPSTIRAKPVQQVSVDTQNNDSKSKKVNFADPVVTKRFTYQRTLQEIEAGSRARSSCTQPSGSPKPKLRPNSFGPKNEDSEDELVTTQSSERDVRKVERVTTRAAARLKRALETSQQTDADGDAIMSDSTAPIASTSHSNSISGDLFSVPKKAKIMPLYEDPPMQERSQSRSGRSPSIEKLSPLSAQENQPVEEGQRMLEVRLMHVSETDEPVQDNEPVEMSESVHVSQPAQGDQSVHENESPPKNESPPENRSPPDYQPPLKNLAKSSQLHYQESFRPPELTRKNIRPRVLRKTTPKRGGPLPSRIHLPGRSGGMKISKDDGLTVQDCNNNETPTINNDHSELISFKKIQMNDTNNEVSMKDTVVDEKNSEQDSRKAGYFAWFSIMLAHHMSSVFRNIKI